MLGLVTPHLQLDSVLELTAEMLRSEGRTGLLLDLDCTLKDYRAQEIGLPVREWIRDLKASGVRLCLLSNGKKHRIARYASDLQIPFVAKALKPLPFGCRAAIRLLDLSPQNVAIVGDQVFADIMAGRLAKLFTVLVRPTSSDEPIWTRVKRPFERFVLKHNANRSDNSYRRTMNELQSASENTPVHSD